MSAQPGQVVVQSDAGVYLAWSGANQPPLALEGLASSRVELQAQGGLLLPQLANAPTLSFVLGGSGVAGVYQFDPAGGDVALATPPPAAARERLVRINTGDVIALRTGDVSWWYNDKDDGAELSILFMADTARSSVSPGNIISNSFLAGANGVMRGFDPSLLAAAWPRATEEQAAAAFRSQPALILTRQQLRGLRPRETDRDGLVVNAAVLPPDDAAHVAGRGTVKTLTGARLQALRGLGISARLVQLEPGATLPPWVLREGAAQAVYVARGSARVQVSSAAGGDTLLLDEEVPAGSLFVVPRFAVACVQAAGADGVELVTLIKSARPVVEQLTGKGSVLGSLTPQLLQAALNVSPEVVELIVTAAFN